MTLPTASQARKFLVAAGGALTEMVALGVLPETYGHWVAVAIAVLTAAGVYQVPNDPGTGSHSPVGLSEPSHGDYGDPPSLGGYRGDIAFG